MESSIPQLMYAVPSTSYAILSCNAFGGYEHLMSQEYFSNAEGFMKLLEDVVTEIICKTYENRRLKLPESRKMEEFRKYVEDEFAQRYAFKFNVELFGSAKNGFGVIDSDADMCIDVLPENEGTGKVPSRGEFLNQVAYIFEELPIAKYVQPVLNATVPVVKITCDETFNYLQADVTVRNKLAVFNTKLLRRYSELDRRVVLLGIAFKEWAKSCNIVGAAQGRLSSYACIIMVIHFLQQITPAVLPYLQEISTETQKKAPVIVSGWDVYYCDSPDFNWDSENTQSVGELWRNFLDYYANHFDFQHRVLQIRNSNFITKYEKGWQKRPFAFEDPFVRRRNIAGNVDSDVYWTIRKIFSLSVRLFSSPQLVIWRGSVDMTHLAVFLYQQSYNERIICAQAYGTCTQPQSSNLSHIKCFRCKRRGHFVEHCPVFNFNAVQRSNIFARQNATS